jgi:hypothetical protein
VFINLVLATAISVAATGSRATRTLPVDVSSKVGSYLLVATACDRMAGTNAGEKAAELSTTILQAYGFSQQQSNSMFREFIDRNLDYYIDTVRQASDNNDAAIRYFCSSTIKQKQETVEEIKARNLP